ncbi:MAG TPA: T9SS type A sorting domain-containing protein [Bacteroidales bacterium]|nr:T9SS type A sorting domain-containing protein [Bacteroidales bacterium]HPS16727.1 T9SS type A sorting domain-containing protein [Bacteroidales bacterium]
MKKKYIIFLVFALFANIAFGQNAATPNAGFENWTSATGYSNPNNWSTLNSTTATYFIYTCLKATAAGEYHSGASAIKLITKNAVITTAQGIATTGKIYTNTSTMTGSITGGLPYTLRPDSIVGWYRSSPVSNDTGFVQFLLFGSARDTIGKAQFFVPATAVSTFKRFSKAITYRSANTPDSSLWILSSSTGATGQQVNSTLWIDDLDLVFNTTSVPENNIYNDQINLIWNPSANNIAVSNKTQENANLKIYDILGQEIGSYAINDLENNFDVPNINNGVYLYTITNNKGNVLLNSKLFIQR